MWKKIGWASVFIYTIGIIFLSVTGARSNSVAGNFDIVNTLITFLLFALPAVFVALELIGRRVFVLFHILGLIFIAIMLLGILNFNTMGLETIGKALVLIPMLGCLGYFGFRWLFTKKKPAAG